jgi:hypothetical protein
MNAELNNITENVEVKEVEVVVDPVNEDGIIATVINTVEEPKEEEVEEEVKKEEPISNEVLVGLIAELTKELAAIKGGNTGMKKNHKVGKPVAGRKYVLLTNTLEKWGKVPQQQSDIATLLTKSFKVGEEFTEAEAFDALVDNSGDYVSMTKSVQDPTYLFKYYRGLKNDGKYAGFVARNFIKQIG